MAAPSPSRPNGDEWRWTLRDECPDAFDRLHAFYWEDLRDREPPDNAQSILRRGKPITVERGRNRDGLQEAAGEVLRCVQLWLYRFHDADEPLDMASAVELHELRVLALNALLFLGGPEGQKVAKDVQASVSPNGRPLAVCVGSNKQEQVPLYFCARLEEWPMFGYISCLRTFPDPDFGRGRRWPRQCPRCRERRTNHREAARTALRWRAAELTDVINSRA